MRLGQGQVTLARRAAQIVAHESLGEGRIAAQPGMMPGPPPNNRRDLCEDCGTPTPATALRSLPGDRTRRCRPCWNAAKRRRA